MTGRRLNRPGRYAAAAGVAALVIGIATLSPVGVAGGAPPSESPQPAQDVRVTNTETEPVPVAEVNNAPDPLWQGTPVVKNTILTSVDSYDCENIMTVPSGKTLFLERAVATFNTAPGRAASAAIGFTVAGASAFTLDIPAFVSAPAAQVAGTYDGYAGTVEIGLPVTGAVEGCFGAVSGSDVSGEITLIGYLVPA